MPDHAGQKSADHIGTKNYVPSWGRGRPRNLKYCEWLYYCCPVLSKICKMIIWLNLSASLSDVYGTYFPACSLMAYFSKTKNDQRNSRGKLWQKEKKKKKESNSNSNSIIKSNSNRVPSGPSGSSGSSKSSESSASSGSWGSSGLSGPSGSSGSLWSAGSWGYLNELS